MSRIVAHIADGLLKENQHLKAENAELRAALADIRALCALDTPLLPGVLLDLIPTMRRSVET